MLELGDLPPPLGGESPSFARHPSLTHRATSHSDENRPDDRAPRRFPIAGAKSFRRAAPRPWSGFGPSVRPSELRQLLAAHLSDARIAAVGLRRLVVETASRRDDAAPRWLLVVRLRNSWTFEAPLAAPAWACGSLGIQPRLIGPRPRHPAVLGPSGSAATYRVLRPRQASTSGTSRCHLFPRRTTRSTAFGSARPRASPLRSRASGAWR